MGDTTMVDGSRADDVFDALANQRRRQLLVQLVDERPRPDESLDPVELLSGVERTTDFDSARIELFHVHLPKLSKQGFIDWNRETGEICLGCDWEDIESVVQILHQNQDELPDGLV